MTLNGVMPLINLFCVTRYFIEFGTFRRALRNGKGGWRCRRKKFTFAISSPDEFLVVHGGTWQVKLYSWSLVNTCQPRHFRDKCRTHSRPIAYKITNVLFMVVLCNRADHYIFTLWFLSFFFLSFFFFSSPNLSGRRLDVYHTYTHGVALVRI